MADRKPKTCDSAQDVRTGAVVDTSRPETPAAVALVATSYALVLEAAPSNLPPDQRLKMLLKIAWRGFRLRVVRCEPAQTTEG